MKIEIKTTGREIELANYVISTAIDELQKEQIRENMQLTKEDVLVLQMFLSQLRKAYSKKFKI